MSRETSMLLAVQRRTAGPWTLPVSRLLRRVGEPVLDSRVRQQWVRALLAVATSPGSSRVLSGVALGTAVAAVAPCGRTGHGR